MAIGEPLRVLYSFPHPIGGPGINTTAWQQVAALAASGADVTVYCTSVGVPLPPAVSVITTLSPRGHRIPHRAIGRRRAYAYHDLRVAAVIRRASDQFDVVHCWPGSCIHTVRSARRHGLPSFREVPNAHTATTFADSARASESTGVALPRGASHRFNARRLRREELEFSLADFLLVPSDYVANSFTERGVDVRRLVRHQYGYDPARFHPRGRLDSGRPFTAVFVGRGEPAKGLHLALRTWLDSPASHNVRFLILGRLLPDYRRYLSDMLDHPSVVTLGFVSNVADVLRESDVLVFPTYTEGSALVTYEAMACGVVPLASTSAGAPIRDGIDGFLHEPEDVKALGHQLARLSSDSDLLLRMRQAAIAASANLTWGSAGARLYSAYVEGMARRATHPNPPSIDGGGKEDTPGAVAARDRIEE